jgi:hypothetical protein
MKTRFASFHFTTPLLLFMVVLMAVRPLAVVAAANDTVIWIEGENPTVV